MRVLRAWYPTAHITTSDVRPTYQAQIDAGSSICHLHDASKPTLSWGSQDLTLTNTPFSLWQDIASRQLPNTRWLALLLRLGALAHLGELPTPSVYVLPDRPNFVALWKCNAQEYAHDDGFSTRLMGGPCGWQEYRSPHESTRGKRCPSCGGKVQRTSCDSSEYAWFVWGPQAPCVHVLAKTSLEERKA